MIENRMTRLFARIARIARDDGARTSRAARATARGVTLIEILIVLAIVGLLAGGIAIAVIPKFRESQIKTTRLSASGLQSSADLWRVNHPSECPTAERLKAENQLSAQSNITDAWGNPFKVICDDENLTVVSFGPDGKEGTADDIRVPEAAAPAK